MVKLVLSMDGHVYRRPGEQLKDRCVVKLMKHPLQQMVWGVINSRGVGALHFIEGFLNGEKYAVMAGNIIAPQMTKWFGRREKYLFMHDLAPCHRSNIAKNAFVKHGIPLLEWPSNAPDLNPIENVWRTMKILVHRRIISMKQELLKSGEKISDKEILKQSITHVWFNSKKLRAVSSKCCKSVKNRVEAIKKAKGQWTKY